MDTLGSVAAGGAFLASAPLQPGGHGGGPCSRCQHDPTVPKSEANKIYATAKDLDRHNASSFHTTHSQYLRYLCTVHGNDLKPRPFSGKTGDRILCGLDDGDWHKAVDGSDFQPCETIWKTVRDLLAHIVTRHSDQVPLIWRREQLFRALHHYRVPLTDELLDAFDVLAPSAADLRKSLKVVRLELADAFCVKDGVEPDDRTSFDSGSLKNDLMTRELALQARGWLLANTSEFDKLMMYEFAASQVKTKLEIRGLPVHRVDGVGVAYEWDNDDEQLSSEEEREMCEDLRREARSREKRKARGERAGGETAGEERRRN